MALRGSRHRPREQDRGVRLSVAGGSGTPREPGGRELLVVALGLAAALVLPFALVHVDDADGVVYTVIARHLARGGHPFDPGFLPELFPHFREHPPFFFWVWALALRWIPEAALPLVGAACGLATVALAFVMGRALAGPRAGFLGAIALATTESFFRYQARVRLDPPLALLFTASVAFIVLARGRTAWSIAGGMAAGMGALVKGPPALGAPLAAALVLVALGRARELSRARTWLAVALPAMSMPAAFLIFDRIALDGTWWHGYVESQVLASALGLRHDGATDRLFLLRSVVGRMGPWSLLAGVALTAAVRRPRAPRSRATWASLAWATVIVGGYSLAGRSWWHYAMPAYVPLSLAAGLGAEYVLDGLGPRAFRFLQRAVTIGAVALLALLPLRLARHLVGPCPLGHLPRLAAMAAPDGRLALYSDRVALVEAGILAQHAHLQPVPIVDPGRLASRQDLHVALVEDRVAAPPGWEELARHGHWTLVRDRGAGKR